MSILIDTNIILTYLTGREDKYSDSIEKIMELCAKGGIKGYMAFHTLSTTWYVLEKQFKNLRREMLKEICEFIKVIGCEHDAVLEALNNEEFKDFEDNLQAECAAASSSDYIVTANVKDYTVSKVKAISPEQFIQIISQNG